MAAAAVTDRRGPAVSTRTADGACSVLETDTVPLGCMDDLEVSPRPPLTMEPGDLFVVLSDGVVDAAGASGERFGTGRVIEVLMGHRERAAAEVMAALRQALARFTDGVPTDDDRTAVIIKRQ